MRASIFAVPLLIGAGFLIGLFATETAQAQREERGAEAAPGEAEARPIGPRKPAPAPAASRPAPRPSAPTMSRPQAQPRPQVQRPAQHANRPARSGRGRMGHPTPISRPTTPRPVNPAARPGIPKASPAARPSPMPGLGGGGARAGCTAELAQREPPRRELQLSDRRFGRSDRTCDDQATKLPNRPTTPDHAIGEKPVIQSPGRGGRRRPVAEQAGSTEPPESSRWQVPESA